MCTPEKKRWGLYLSLGVDDGPNGSAPVKPRSAGGVSPEMGMRMSVGDGPDGGAAPVNPRSTGGVSLEIGIGKSVATAPVNAGSAGVLSLEKGKEKEGHVQRVAEADVELEKILHKMHGETSEVKSTSDKKLAEAHVLVADCGRKYLEIEGKLHFGNAKIVEASRMGSEIYRKKLDDVEAHEHKLKEEYLSISNGPKNNEKIHDAQSEFLRERERNLLEGQKRLLERPHSVNDRQERANETDRVLKKKEEELKKAWKMIEITENSQKEKEDDISKRQKALSSKDKEDNIKIENLENKEKDLLAREENLNARERVEKSNISEELKRSRADIAQKLELRTRVLEMNMWRKHKDMEQQFKVEQDQIEREKEELSKQRKQLESNQLQFQNDRKKLIEDEILFSLAREILLAVVKAILEETWKEKNDGPPNGVSKGSFNVQEKNQRDSVHADMVARSSGEKRCLAHTSGRTAGEMDAEDNETHPERSQKRRKISAHPTQSPGKKRYNLRSSSIYPSIDEANPGRGQKRTQN